MDASSLPAFAGDEVRRLRGVRLVVGRYEADTEQAVRLLPREVEPAEDPVRCAAWGLSVPSAPAGAHLLSLVTVEVVLQGRPYRYCPFYFSTSPAGLGHAPLLAAWSKRIATITFGGGGRQKAFVLERPRGTRIMTITMTPENPVTLEDNDAFGTGPVLTHEVPATVTGRSGPVLHRLIRTRAAVDPSILEDGSQAALCTGRASVTMDELSDIDPLYRLAPVRMLAALHGTVDLSVTRGAAVVEAPCLSATGDER